MRLPALALAAVLAATAAASAATPAPAPAPTRINVEKLQPKELAPKVPLHSEYIVEVNRLGQVARVRSVKPSKNPTYDAQTYGNALQAFIRTPDGNALAGTYRLTYDYSPKTMRVHRDVALVHAGGVNPNAQGAALQMMEIAKKNAGKHPAAGTEKQPANATLPSPSPGVVPPVRRLPDLPQVMNTPSH
jgi:hypothetical protein